MFAIRSIVKRCFSLYPNAFDISRRRTSSSKPTLPTLSNVCYWFEILSHRNNRRKNDEEDHHRSTKKVSFRITKADLMPHAQLMYEQFFRLLTSEKSYENEYVMRAVMRLSSSLQDGVVPYLNQLMEKLVLILRRAYRVSENTLTLIIRSSLSLWEEPQQTELQSLSLRNDQCAHSIQCLAEPIDCRSIGTTSLSDLHSDLHRRRRRYDFIWSLVSLKGISLEEFVPYVLQIIGFLLESHRTGATIPDAYRALFNSIISPTFWDRTGNIPALSRLLQAYIEKAGETIVMEKLVRERERSKRGR